MEIYLHVQDILEDNGHCSRAGETPYTYVYMYMYKGTLKIIRARNKEYPYRSPQSLWSILMELLSCSVANILGITRGSSLQMHNADGVNSVWLVHLHLHNYT